MTTMMNISTCNSHDSRSDTVTRTDTSAADNLCGIASFLADYAALLSGCGATCIRIEKNTRRIARAFDVQFDIFILPAHLTVSVWHGDSCNAVTAMRKTVPCGISFNLNARLSRLSWEVADNHLDLDTAILRFDKIRETKPTGWKEVLILTSLANASFCRLFGGDFVAMLIVFVSTMAGFRLKQIMLEHKHDIRQPDDRLRPRAPRLIPQARHAGIRAHPHRIPRRQTPAKQLDIKSNGKNRTLCVYISEIIVKFAV